MESIQYPTGKFTPKGEALSSQERARLIERIGEVPDKLRAAVDGLSDEQLGTPYREGGWSPRQITHHLADAHLNAFIRFKLAVTEDRPTIKPYDQDAWAEQADVLDVPVSSSLAIVEGVHARWIRLLRALAHNDFGRELVHPEIGDIDLDFLLQLYGWHGHHHVTQIIRLRELRGW